MTDHVSPRGWAGAMAVMLAVGVTAARPHAGRAADPAAIRQAISQGAECLKRMQGRGGAWEMMGHPLGETALAGLALLAAGEPADSRVMQAAGQAVRSLKPNPGTETYEVSLAIMFLDQLDGESHANLIQNLARRLVAGQCTDGSWTYVLGGGSRTGDNSNTQFAALASWIGRRYRAVPDETLLRVDRYFRQSVTQDGGWGYGPGDGSDASMTCAGLVALAAERGAVIQRSDPRRRPDGEQTDRDAGPPRGLAAAGDPVVTAALANLGRTLQAGPAAMNGHGLYLWWSVERVGVIYGLERIGGVDWYQWGAVQLLRLQTPEGGWIGPQPTVVDTSFALLFLCRANVAEDLTAEIGGWVGGDDAAVPPARKQYMRVERRARPPVEPPATPR